MGNEDDGTVESDNDGTMRQWSMMMGQLVVIMMGQWD